MIDYLKDLEIEKDALDTHWVEQPVLFMRYAEQAALAEEIRDKAKRAVEVARAEADTAIREKAINDGEKLTEAKVANRVSVSPEVDSAERGLIEAAKNAKLLGAAVRAFEQKKKALEKLSELYISGYWSAPSESTTKKIEEKLNKKIGE